MPLARGSPAPGDEQGRQRSLLVKLNRSVTIQLQEREETRDQHRTGGGVMHQLSECHAPLPGEHRGEHEDLLAHRHEGIMQVGDLNGRDLGCQRVGGQPRQILRGCRPREAGKHDRKVRFEGDLAPRSARCR